MADNKKYYYLKLKDNFFDSDEMVVLESMPDGYIYTNILLKLYLRSLKYDGRLMFNDRIPFNSTMLAQITRCSVGDVERAVKIFEQLNLIEVLDNGAIYMLEIQNFIGESSTEADRKRALRNKIDQEKNFLLLQNDQKTNVGQTSGQMSDKRDKSLVENADKSTFIEGGGQMSDKCQPELEIELEKELEIKKDILSGRPDYMPAIKEIIDYLNKKTSSNYRPSTKATQTKIKARLAEGFNVDDFKRVIDIKCAEWLNDANMSQYLRPETLFGTKFESYSQQKGPAAKKQITQSYQGYQRPQKTEVLTDWESLAQSAQRTPEEQAALDEELDRQLQEFYKEEPK
ncbi:phage replisome organizer N-terminal domain-containing protein [Enterococcus sp. 2201sp1_2201st1_B8_2201SCRN_220225]|uniref:phage replisome organizer N-terminal domain-containing protein n=1 Tax=unclassified Enterococcus TaxID=2608891 RepID=UPI0034A55A63